MPGRELLIPARNSRERIAGTLVRSRCSTLSLNASPGTHSKENDTDEEGLYHDRERGLMTKEAD